MIVEPSYGATLRRGGKKVAWYCGQHFHDNAEESRRCYRFHFRCDDCDDGFWHYLAAREEKQFNTTYYIRSHLEPAWGAYIRESLLSIASNP